jgi:hypothetical protein
MSTIKGWIKDFLAWSGLWSIYDAWEFNRLWKEVPTERSPETLEVPRRSTLFILGSGYSVNAIDPETWSHIARGVSVGFNAWVLHPHIPDFYFLETSAQPEVNEGLAEAYRTAPAEAKTKPVLFNARHLKNHPWDLKAYGWPDEQVKWIPSLSLHTSNPLVVRWWLQRMERKTPWKGVIHVSATLGMLTHWGLRQGFKDIVLVGIDLNDRRYFFEGREDARSKAYAQMYTRLLEKTQRRTEVHATLRKDINRRYGSMPVDAYLNILQARAKQQGTVLWVQNPGSALAAFLPVWKPELTA